jgi:hypothetical protein
MKNFEITGRDGNTVNIVGECLASVAALNHDETVRSTMRLIKTTTGYVCESVSNPHTPDAQHRMEHCNDVLSVYQFFGTLPLANYLYGTAKMEVPGLVQTKE